MPLEHRTRAIGLFLSTLVAGQALGVALGGLLAQVASWRPVFVILGMLAATVVLALNRSQPLLNAPEKSSEAPQSAAGFSGYFAILRVRPALFGCLAIEAFAVVGAFPFVGATLVADYGLGYGATGVLLPLYAVGAVIGSRLRLNNARLRLRFGGTLLAASFVTIAMDLGVAACGVAILTLGLGFSLAHATLQSTATEIAPDRRASALSLFSFTANAVGALGTAATGVVFDTLGSRARGFRCGCDSAASDVRGWRARSASSSTC